MKKVRRIEIRGNQAPYGIGEIMVVMPAAHWRRALEFAGEYYNAPTLHCQNCGKELDWTYNRSLDIDGIEVCNCIAYKED
jgi:hypothetical protein